MKSNFEKIKTLIAKSKISFPDKEELILILTKATDEELKPILNLIKSDLSWVNKINSNYKAKQVALATNNSNLWKKILTKEITQLKAIKNNFHKLM